MAYVGDVTRQESSDPRWRSPKLFCCSDLNKYTRNITRGCVYFNSRGMAFGRWVLGPFLNDMSERNTLDMTSVGRGHIFNHVSDVTCVFFVQLYENDISASHKLHDTEK